MAIWNPWHGCHRISAGCVNCYVYRRDDSVGRDAAVVSKTADFDLPVQRDRMKIYKLQPDDGVVYTCMTSDFFLEDADDWRPECWKMIRKRQDLSFFIITKRIHRFLQCIPEDWGEGYPNATICCTCENQDRTDFRLPIFLDAPICHRTIIHEPMLGPIDIQKYLSTGKIDKVICGGESGSKARPCCYDWILSVREQCIQSCVEFHFKQTGAVFVKEGRTYHIPRKLQQSQAAKAGIDYFPETIPADCGRDKWLERDIFERILASKFRSRFHLSDKDCQYIRQKGLREIRRHAEDFISQRLAPAEPEKDGKQTPMRGHPVFIAQHACACCCRDCLEKWHGIPKGTPLTAEQQSYIADILLEWICRQSERTEDGFLHET